MLYEWYYHNLYSIEECRYLQSKLNDIDASDRFRDTPGKDKNTHTKVVDTLLLEKDLDKFFRSIRFLNERYFGFKLFDRNPETINVNNYTVGKQYPLHKDSADSGTLHDLKLTAILNISNDSYTGGEFDLFLGDFYEILDISNPGTLLVFPSFTYHRVRPVLSGKRTTLSVWMDGPNFR